MHCEAAHLIVPEDWQAIRVHPRSWKQYSDEEVFFIVALANCPELLRTYPAAILFIGRGTELRVAEILHDLRERGLAYCQLDEVDTPEVLRRIAAYHNWLDGSGRPIPYRQDEKATRCRTKPTSKHSRHCSGLKIQGSQSVRSPRRLGSSSVRTSNSHSELLFHFSR